VSGDPHIEYSCDTVGWRGDLAKVLHCEACPSWASGESRVRPLLEEALGRGVNSPGLLFLPEAGFGRGEIASLEWTGP
jgi:hypothetical protein